MAKKPCFSCFFIHLPPPPSFTYSHPHMKNMAILAVFFSGVWVPLHTLYLSKHEKCSQKVVFLPTLPPLSSLPILYTHKRNKAIWAVFSVCVPLHHLYRSECEKHNRKAVFFFPLHFRHRKQCVFTYSIQIPTTDSEIL